MRVLSFFLLLSFSIAAHSQTPRIDRIDIIEAGIYERQSSSTTLGQSSTGGTLVIADLKLIKSTTTIPARIGTSFGVRFRLIGQPFSGKAILKVVTRIPPPGIRNTDTNQMQLTSEITIIKTIGAEHTFDNIFESPGHLITGNWVMEIWHENRKLAQQQFTVVKP